MSIFSKVPRGKLVRNRYDMSYTNNYTMQTGLIYPVYIEETIPGDVFSVGSGAVIRSQPMLAPLLSNYYAEMRFFYVPNRLVWDDFKAFMMDQPEGVAELRPGAYKHPTVTPNVFEMTIGSVFDFFGIPFKSRSYFNALPFRMYNLIWNEFFRDQNLQDALTIPVGMSGDSAEYYKLMRCNWRKDYFTSALPWTQRGEAISLPADVLLRSMDYLRENGIDPYQVVKTADVEGGHVSWRDADWAVNGSSAYGGVLRSLDPDQFGGAQINSLNPGGALGYNYSLNTSQASSNITAGAAIDPNGTLGVNINVRDLRYATAVQRFLEREALVGGGRYADWIRGIYGVNIGDATLQRPLYLGGGRTAINVSPVEQMSSTDNTSPQGNLAGKGFGSALFRMNKPTLIAEHGWVIGLMYIRPEAIYYQGINRHMTKETRYDYVIPGFERLGEQAIKSRELYDVRTGPGDTPQEIQAYIDAENNKDFGYTSRQAEYKSHNSEVHGQIKTDLSQWSLTRGYPDDLEQAPALNSDFIEVNPDESQIFAVSPEVSDPWIVNLRNVAFIYRPLQKYPVYGL